MTPSDARASVSGVGTAVGFKGVDRRAIRMASVPGWHGTGRFAAALAVGAALLSCWPAAAVLLGVPAFGVDAWPLAAASGLVGLVVIGGWLGAWLWSGRLRPALMALGLVPAWVLAEVSGLSAGSSQPSIGAALAISWAGAALVTLGFLRWSRRAPDVDTAWRPLRWIAALTIGTVGVLFLAVAGSETVGFSDEAAAAVALVAAAVWTVAAFVVFGSRAFDAAQRRWSACAFVAFAVAACERAAGLLSDSHDFSAWATFSARAVVLAGWMLAFLAMARSVARARKLAAARQRSMRVAHDVAARELMLQQRRDAERRHDLRSLVAGIQGATSTLANYRGLLDAAEQRRLESALLSEIHRLRDTIEPLSSTPDRFHLARVLAPVLTLERSHGAVIEETIDDVAVFGDPAATVALVQNLLVNARRHAPGSLVTITTAADADLVRLRVSDDGPGLPTDVETRIRSVLDGAPQVIPAQPNATGHGLGLAICAHLARDQGATLRLVDVGVGTCFELTLGVARQVTAPLEASASS